MPSWGSSHSTLLSIQEQAQDASCILPFSSHFERSRKTLKPYRSLYRQLCAIESLHHENARITLNKLKGADKYPKRYQEIFVFILHLLLKLFFLNASNSTATFQTCLYHALWDVSAWKRPWPGNAPGRNRVNSYLKFISKLPFSQPVLVCPSPRAF